MVDDMQKLKDLAVSDSGFVFDPYSGSTFSVNATGLAILQALKAGSDREQLLEQLEQGFTIQQGNDLPRDIDEFIQLLRREGMLPPDFNL